MTQFEYLRDLGRAYVTLFAASVPVSGYCLFRLATRPTGEAAVVFEFESSENLLVNFESDTFSAPGVELTPSNLNQTSSRSAEHRIFRDPTGTGSPTRIIPSQGTDTGRGIFFEKDQSCVCGSFVIRDGSEYLLSCQNIGTIAASVGVGIYVTELE